MSTITREFTKWQLIAFATEILKTEASMAAWDCMAGRQVRAGAAIAEIALASLEAEHVAFRSKLKPPSAIGSERWDYTEHRQPDAFELENCVIERLFTAPPAQKPLKDHQIRELVNELRDIAIEYQGTQQLRERIARTVSTAMLQGAESAESRSGNTPVIPDGLIAAVNRLLDSDGSRGCYSALRCYDAHAEVERLLSAAPQQEVK